ncbi:MAG: ABC transporter permease [Desulfurococcales archaeon]|nr:ABC transporter permease [Desulfurococcales archaeon]
MYPVIAVARMELAREVRKRSFYFLLFLAVLPIISSLILRYGMDRTVSDPSFWAVVMGFKTTGQVSFQEIVNLGTFMWLIALLYGGDLLASDLSDGTARLVLARGVRRLEYLAAKVLTVTLVLSLISASTGVAAFLSNAVLMGSMPPLEDLPLAIGLGALLGVGALPLLLLAASIGAMARKSLHGIVLGFVTHLVVSTAIVIYVGLKITATASPEDLANINTLLAAEQMKAMAYDPYQAGLALPSLLYWVANGGVIRDPLLTSQGIMLDATSLAGTYALSTLIGIALHIAFTAYILERADL